VAKITDKDLRDLAEFILRREVREISRRESILLRRIFTNEDEQIVLRRLLVDVRRVVAECDLKTEPIKRIDQLLKKEGY
jgi:hypothetical protein